MPHRPWFFKDWKDQFTMLAAFNTEGRWFYLKNNIISQGISNLGYGTITYFAYRWNIAPSIVEKFIPSPLIDVSRSCVGYLFEDVFFVFEDRFFPQPALFKLKTAVLERLGIATAPQDSDDEGVPCRH